MMRPEQWLAISLAVLSLALFLGWPSLNKKQIKNQFWENMAVRHAAVFFYFVGIPYLALVFGILSPRLLGLKGLEYFVLIDWAGDFLAAEIQQAVTLTLLEWLLDSSATILSSLVALLIFVGLWRSLSYYGVKIALRPSSGLNTVYFALHWAFYRAVFWLITDDLYLGVVLGVGFVLLEWILSYKLQGQWLGRQQQFLVDSMILISTASIFFYSPNLWLLLPVHLAMVVLINKQEATRTVTELAE